MITAQKFTTHMFLSTCKNEENLFFQTAAIQPHGYCLLWYIVKHEHIMFPSSLRAQILLLRCLSRFLSVCPGSTKVSRSAVSSRQPWAANWPGNVCSPPSRHLCVPVSISQTQSAAAINCSSTLPPPPRLGHSGRFNVKTKDGHARPRGQTEELMWGRASSKRGH